jgi:hypothetical protein
MRGTSKYVDSHVDAYMSWRRSVAGCSVHRHGHNQRVAARGGAGREHGSTIVDVGAQVCERLGWTMAETSPRRGRRRRRKRGPGSHPARAGRSSRSRSVWRGPRFKEEPHYICLPGPTLTPPHVPGDFASGAPVHKEQWRMAEERVAEKRHPKIDRALVPASPARQVSMEPVR